MNEQCYAFLPDRDMIDWLKVDGTNEVQILTQTNVNFIKRHQVGNYVYEMITP